MLKKLEDSLHHRFQNICPLYKDISWRS